jgi:hypothetical protein
MTEAQEMALRALTADGKEIATGKGGVWIKGEKWVSWAGVYRRYGITPTPRPKAHRIGAYGDYATIALINGIKA